jgi:hypothetical protein
LRHSDRSNCRSEGRTASVNPSSGPSQGIGSTSALLERSAGKILVATLSFGLALYLSARRGFHAFFTVMGLKLCPCTFLFLTVASCGNFAIKTISIFSHHSISRLFVLFLDVAVVTTFRETAVVAHAPIGWPTCLRRWSLQFLQSSFSSTDKKTAGDISS